MDRRRRSRESIPGMYWRPAASTSCRTAPLSPSPTNPNRAQAAAVEAVAVMEEGVEAGITAAVEATAAVGGVPLLESIASLYSASGCDVAVSGGDHAGGYCRVFSAAGLRAAAGVLSGHSNADF